MTSRPIGNVVSTSIGRSGGAVLFHRDSHEQHDADADDDEDGAAEDGPRLRASGRARNDSTPMARSGEIATIVWTRTGLPSWTGEDDQHEVDRHRHGAQQHLRDGRDAGSPRGGMSNSIVMAARPVRMPRRSPTTPTPSSASIRAVTVRPPVPMAASTTRTEIPARPMPGKASEQRPGDADDDDERGHDLGCRRRARQEQGHADDGRERAHRLGRQAWPRPRRHRRGPTPAPTRCHQQARCGDMEREDRRAPDPVDERRQPDEQQAVHRQQDADELARGVARRQILADEPLAHVDDGCQQGEGDSAHRWMLGSVGARLQSISGGGPGAGAPGQRERPRGGVSDVTEMRRPPITELLGRRVRLGTWEDQKVSTFRRINDGAR